MDLKKNGLLVGALAVVVVALVLVFAASRLTSDISTVESEDGVVQLEIPKGALPEGVTSEDISIIDVTSELDWFTDEEGNAIVKRAYSLEPNGITFSEPVSFVMRYLPVGDEALLPAIAHVTETSFDMINDIEVEKGEDGALLMKGSISHLSQLLQIDHPFEAFFRGAGEFPVGKSFDFTVLVEQRFSGDYPIEAVKVKTKEKPQYDWTYHYAKLLESDWKVAPIKIKLSGGGKVVTPKEATIAGKTLSKISDFEGKAKLLCAKAGSDRITLPDGVKIEYTFKLDEDEEKQIPQIAKYKVKGTADEYRMKSTFHFASDNTNLLVKCVSPAGTTEPVTTPETEAGDDFILLGPPYTIICGGGTSLSGIYKADPKTGEIVRDAQGNGIDYDTGKSVVCP